MESSKQISTLDMTWDYFKLLAQQRVTHFNLFIVFIGAISTVYTTQINVDLRGNIVACTLSFIEMFLCFIFYKIDLRNKFLIKHTEMVIKQYEQDLEDNIPRLFISEENATNKLRDEERGKIYFLRQLSTSQLYNLFYTFFVLMGLFGLILSMVFIILK